MSLDETAEQKLLDAIEEVYKTTAARPKERERIFKKAVRLIGAAASWQVNWTEE